MTPYICTGACMYSITLHAHCLLILPYIAPSYSPSSSPLLSLHFLLLAKPLSFSLPLSLSLSIFQSLSLSLSLHLFLSLSLSLTFSLSITILIPLSPYLHLFLFISVSLSMSLPLSFPKSSGCRAEDLCVLSEDVLCVSWTSLLMMT